MTFPPPSSSPSNPPAFYTEKTHRQKQIRVLLSIHGMPRLPPHNEAMWHTSSLYTFSPYSGLIQSHEVEAIRPLPGEGVVEWLTSRMLGWTSRHGGSEGAIPCPRAVPVELDRRYLEAKSLEGALRELTDGHGGQ